MVTREKAQTFVETLSWLMGFAAASDWDDLLLRVPDHLEEMREHFRGVALPDGGLVQGEAIPPSEKSSPEKESADAWLRANKPLPGRCHFTLPGDATKRCARDSGHDGTCMSWADRADRDDKGRIDDPIPRAYPERPNRFDIVGKPQFYRCGEKKRLDSLIEESTRQCRLNEGHAGDHLWHPEKGDRP